MVKRIEHVTEDGVEKRWCGKCKNFKPLHIFGYSKSTWDNLRPTCKECIHEYNEEVAESRTEYNKQYWKDTMEKQKEKSKKWREENPEKVKESMRRWLEENKEYKKQKDKEYREAHKEAYKDNHRKWSREQYHKMKKENDLGQAWDWSGVDPIRDPVSEGCHLTETGSLIRVRRAVALMTALVFAWTMICPLGFAETINLAGRLGGSECPGQHDQLECDRQPRVECPRVQCPPEQYL